MAKNCMAAVAKMLGVELGEKFIIENAEHNLQVVLAADGLHISAGDYFGRPNGFLLQKVLCGLFEVKEKPWEPKEGDKYYFPYTTLNCVAEIVWKNSVLDHTLKVRGMVYRTKEEAEAHFASDYEKLTGKKLEG